MVLLQADQVPVWGWADIGESVAVTLNGQTRTSVADSNGKWQVELNLEHSPPGPFEMLVQGKNTIQISDVLVGEVWLGSGQSNMEQAMMSQKHAEMETATADNTMLRQFITIKKASLTPKNDVDGFWLKVAPGQTDTMSALGYYFSREIHDAISKPVGIIKASWGGRAIESFISPDSFDLDPIRRQARGKKLMNNVATVNAFTTWIDETGRSDRSDIERGPFIYGPVSDSGGWVHVKDSGAINPDLPEYGAIWFRKDVILTKDQSEVPQYLYIGLRDVLFFSVYFNGKLVEHVDMDNYTKETGLVTRIYLTPDVISEGVNKLALRVFAPHQPFSMAWAPSLNGRGITGGWLAKPEFSLPAPPSNKVPPALRVRLEILESTIFNGMIQPLAPYAIRGVIWYQGESNVGFDDEYRKLMPLLIEDWRSHWRRADLPFYYCQLANYREKSSIPGESRWADLRDAQFGALTIPDTGMAVLIDTGESKDIHPQTKDIAGERLARIALANVYGMNIPYSGPIYDSMAIEGSKIRLSFLYTEGGLIAKELPDEYPVLRVRNLTAPLVRNSPSSELEGFAIRGANSDWVWAEARIDPSTSSGFAEDTVIVWSNEVPEPTAVRYAWADNPTCNLYNQANLPAAPFSAEIPEAATSLSATQIRHTKADPPHGAPELGKNAFRQR
jgi:sialate O-acetylesterase